MKTLKTIFNIIKGKAVIITLSDEHRLNMIKGKNLSKTEAMAMSLKVAEILQ